MGISKPNKVITHHAVSLKTHTAKDVSMWHFDRWDGYSPSRRGGDTQFAGYHDVIEWDGTWVKCRDWDEEGIHCRGQNFSSIGVCFMGNNDVHDPSEAQKLTYRTEYYPAVQEAFPHIKATDQYPHRKYANKSCHGKLLSDDYWINVLGYLSERKKITLLLIQAMSQLVSLLKLQRMKG